jgi:hypothetical protein
MSVSTHDIVVNSDGYHDGGSKVKSSGLEKLEIRRVVNQEIGLNHIMANAYGRSRVSCVVSMKENGADCELDDKLIPTWEINVRLNNRDSRETRGVVEMYSQ